MWCYVNTFFCFILCETCLNYDKSEFYKWIFALINRLRPWLWHSLRWLTTLVRYIIRAVLQTKRNFKSLREVAPFIVMPSEPKRTTFIARTKSVMRLSSYTHKFTGHQLKRCINESILKHNKILTKSHDYSML